MFPINPLPPDGEGGFLSAFNAPSAPEGMINPCPVPKGTDT